MKNSCLNKEELERIVSMLENYRKALKECTSTEEVVRVNDRMDAWCRKKLSTAKKTTGSVGSCLDTYTRLRDVATADAANTVNTVMDGSSEKEISYRLKIFWDGKRVKEALEAVDKIDTIASDDSIREEQKKVLYYKQFQLLKNKLMVATPTERLYIVRRWKNGIAILTDAWLKQVQAINGSVQEQHNLSPTGYEEKEKSSAKREREASDELFDGFDKQEASPTSPNEPLYPCDRLYKSYKPWRLMIGVERKFCITEFVLGGPMLRQHLVTSDSVDNLNTYTQRFYNRFELWSTGKCDRWHLGLFGVTEPRTEKLSDPKFIMPMDDELKNYAATYIFSWVSHAVIGCINRSKNEEERLQYANWFMAYCKDLGVDPVEAMKQAKEQFNRKSSEMEFDKTFSEVALRLQNLQS